MSSVNEDSEFRVLFVDDDHITREAFTRSMQWRGIRVDAVETLEQARRHFSEREYEVVVSDVALGQDVTGPMVVEVLHQLCPSTTFVLITGNELNLPPNSVADRVTFALLEKPWDDDHAAAVLRSARAFQAEQRRQHTQSATNVLLLEDNPGDAELMRELLADLGIRPRWVQRLDQALTAIRSEPRPFTVIITDLTLPDARGLDAVTRLRAAAPDAALIVASGLEGETERHAVRFGAQEFLNKNMLASRVLVRALDGALERKRAEQQLLHLAHHDSLTGLANRAMLVEQLPLALAKFRRTGTPCAALFVDLDGFKAVNDSHGHQVGDELLRTVAARISLQVRSYDLVARLGGDEFAVLLGEVDGAANALAIADRIRESIMAPICFGQLQVSVGASIGVAVATTATASHLELLAAADRAMYAAKRAGKNAVRLEGDLAA